VTKHASLNIVLMPERLQENWWPAVYDLLVKAKVTGIPDSYAQCKATFEKLQIVGYVNEDGDAKRVTDVFLFSKEEHGIVYLQAMSEDAMQPVKLRRALMWAHLANPDIACIWTQVARASLAPYLRAGMIPTTPLNIGTPVLVMTHTQLLKLR